MNSQGKAKLTKRATQVVIKQLSNLAAASTISTQKRALSINQAAMQAMQKKETIGVES